MFELRHRGVRCAIEPQVFNVLAYLAEHRDRVVSKEELLEKLWGDRFVSETTLTSRLKAARKAVGDDGKSQRVIRTIHGRGYRFVADIAAPAAVSAPRPAGFVGRDAELARLDTALKDAGDGKRRVVFVAGEAGAGKTSLVEAFLTRDPSLLIARGQCIEHRGSGEPYMPLLDAIGRLCRTARGARIIELLRREAPSWLLQLPWLLSDEEAAALAARSSLGDRMPRELAMLVERISEETPLVLLLEDLHWSDSATLEAIDLLARQPHPARLLIVGTFRPSEVIATVQELRARGQCEVIELPLLGVGEIDDYLRARFPGVAFAPELAALLHARTSGNPLFVGNLVASWIDRGLIGAPMAILETDVPDSLQQLIEKHVAELAEDDQRMLETASVAGREVSIALLAAILATDDEEVERRCEALARAGRFIAPEGTEQWGDGTFTSRFAFTHDLYVDVLYDRIPEARRARIHRQAGLALERAWNGREREHAAELALHFQRAHDLPRAIRYREHAAEQALARSAYREAVLHSTAALELLRETSASPERDRLELDLRKRLAPAFIATRGFADADVETNYDRGCELARALGDEEALSAMLHDAAVMYEFRGEYQKAEQIVRNRMVLDGDAANVKAVQSHELLACTLMHQGQLSAAVQAGESALAAAEAAALPLDAPNSMLLVLTRGWLAGALALSGRREEADAQSALAIRVAESGGDERAVATAFAQAAFVHFYYRETVECRRMAEAAKAIAEERRLPYLLGSANLLLGWCNAQEGALDDALREVRAAIDLSLSIGVRLDLPLFLAVLAECLDLAGDSKGALDTLDEAFAFIGRKRSYYYLPELYRMSANLLLARGDRDTAHSALERARTIADEHGAAYFAGRVGESMRLFPPSS